MARKFSAVVLILVSIALLRAVDAVSYKYQVQVKGVTIGRKFTLTAQYESLSKYIASDPEVFEFTLPEDTPLNLRWNPPSCVTCNVSTAYNKVVNGLRGGNGTVSMTKDITTADGPVVTCYNAAPPTDKGCFTLHANVFGLVGDVSFSISYNGALKVIPNNGNFELATNLLNNDKWDVKVETQPNGHQCTVTEAATGSIPNRDVILTTEGPMINCVQATYKVGGQVWGLQNGETLTANLSYYQPKGTPARQVACSWESASASTKANPCLFTFPGNFHWGDVYQVEIASGGKPARAGVNLYCKVYRESGAVTNADISDVVVDCQPSRLGSNGGNPAAKDVGFVNQYTAGGARRAAGLVLAAGLALAALLF